MHLHSDFLIHSDLNRARRIAGVGFTRLEEKGSRSRDRQFDIILTGSSPRNQNMGGPDKAATWDEWGIFLGVLFNIDPAAHTAKHGYESGPHFHWSTGNRFAHPLTPKARHGQHHWEWAGHTATGSYTVHECECGALMRRMLSGSFATLG